MAKRRRAKLELPAGAIAVGRPLPALPQPIFAEDGALLLRRRTRRALSLGRACVMH